MARVSSKKRKSQIRAKHKRKKKLKKFREVYGAAKTASEKEKILEKVHRISPLLLKEEFLKSTKDSPTKGKSLD